MGALLAFSQQQETTNCYKCGITFSMPAVTMAERREDHESFYCPNGHSQHFTGPSEAEKLRKQLEEKDRAIAREREWRTSAEARVATKDRQLSAARGRITRKTNQLQRVACGVCPLCKRNFKALREHMETKHPAFRTEESATHGSEEK